MSARTTPGERSQQLALAHIGRDAVCREVAAIEIARGSLIEAEEVCAVEPFEVEQLQDRLSHAHIGKDRAPCIEHQALHALWQSVGQVFLDDTAVAHCRKVVSGLPAPRISLDPQIVEPFLERFEVCVAVAIIVVTDRIEIPETAIDGEIASPVVLVACEGDALAGFHIADGIGPAAKQRVEAGVLECIGVDGVLCQHRHKSDDERQFAVVSAGKVEAHRARIGRFGFGDLDVIGAEIWPAFVAQQLPGKNHVSRRHRLAVGEARRRIDPEADVGACGIGHDAVGQQAVERERLVVAAGEQAFDDVAPHIGSRQSFHDEGVEAVEGAEHALRQVPAFRCLRIGVGWMGEVRPPYRFPVHCDGMSSSLGMRRAQTETQSLQTVRRARRNVAMDAKRSPQGQWRAARVSGECDSVRFCRNLS